MPPARLPVIRAPALPSVLCKERRISTDGKAGAPMGPSGIMVMPMRFLLPILIKKFPMNAQYDYRIHATRSPACHPCPGSAIRAMQRTKD